MTTSPPLMPRAESSPIRAADNLSLYRQAMSAIEGRHKDTTPEALGHKHRAVLALARSGASSFAQNEYKRFELDRVAGHEDIMALAGRLAKDRFEAAGDIEQARDSANFYEAAFQSTAGYYSGINAATMSLIAKVPSEIVMGRAQAVLSRLSSLSGETDEDRYFIQASRAEAYYILGDKPSAAAALQAALDFDPLNYTAHASTYRQFRLLAKAYDEDMTWLRPLRAPMSVHFAGHLFAEIKDEDRLSVAMSDLIQKEDIGFGYGALAAGSDIIFAEALLEEGGELHVVLPVSIALFKAKSVTALDEKSGTNWGARFEACLDKASSVRILTEHSIWPDPALNNYAAKVSMGEACAHAQSLSSETGQVLIWDRKTGRSLTAHHAQDWQDAAQALEAKTAQDREQFIIEYPDTRGAEKSQRIELLSHYTLKTGLAKNGKLVEVFATVADALAHADAAMKSGDVTDKYGLHIAPIETQEFSDSGLILCESLSREGLPGSLTVSHDLSALVALDHSALWTTGFAGWITHEGHKTPAYFIKPIIW